MPQAILGIIIALFAFVTIARLSSSDEPDTTPAHTAAIEATTQPVVNFQPAPPPPPPPSPRSREVQSSPPSSSHVAPSSGHRADAPKICRHEGMLDIMSRIRRVCVKGKCDLDKLLTEANTLNLTEFLSLMNIVEQKTMFFFRTGATTLDQGQIDEKIEQLISQLTFMIEDPHNTVTFIIAKASKKGTRAINQKLSSERAHSVFNLIEAALKERNQTMKCDQIYRTYVGAELWDFKVNDAKRAKYIQDEDFARARAFREKPYDFINQSAMVFNFPCFQEMCSYMKRKQGLSCNPNAPADKQLPEECLERVCN